MKKRLFLFLLLSHGVARSFAQGLPGVIASSNKAPYRLLSNIELLVDYTGLATGTTNDYGVVDGSGNITSLKSLAPGPTGRDFASNGTAPTLTADGIVFGGAGRLRHNSASTWNFMSYNATRANLKWTVHAVIKVGTSENPAATLAILGNNAGSGSNKGAAIYFSDDNSTNNNRFSSFLSGGSGSTLTTFQSDAIIPNRFIVLSVETDLSQGSTGRQSVYVNGAFVFNINTNDTGGALVTTPTYDLEIGGLGNATFPLVGTIKELIIQSTVESAQTRRTVVNALLAKHHIVTSEDDMPVRVYNPYNVYNDGRYPITNTLLRSTTNPNILVSVYSDWPAGHVWRATNVISMRKSTDGGATWGARTVLYSDAAWGVIDSGGGVDPDTGEFHMFFDAHTGSGTTIDTGAKILHITSSDDGDTWSSPEDLSALIPSTDIAWCYGGMIKNGSVLMKPFYVLDAPGDTNPNGIYLLRKDGAGAWTAVQVEGNTTNYRNESEIIGLDNTTVLMLSRDDNTFEYRQYISTDNGQTWTNQGAQTLGYSFSYASPLRLKAIEINGTRVIVAHVADRGNRRLQAIYAKASDLIANGLTGWTLATKTTIRQYLTSPVNQPQYGDYSYLNNTMDGIMGFALDDATGSSTATSVIHSGAMQNWHYAAVKSALGLTTP